jgi:hypothetical protein
MLRAFPPDGICDTLSPSDLAPFLEPDSEIPTSGLGLDRLRQEVSALGFSLPANLDLEVGDLDLAALGDECSGCLRTYGPGADMGILGLGMFNIDEDKVALGGGMATVNQYAGGCVGSSSVLGAGGGGGRGGSNRARDVCSTDDLDSESNGRGRYSGGYGDRQEDDFLLSYS